MIDIKIIRQDPEKVKKLAALKGKDVPVERILELDLKKRTLLQRFQNLRHKQKVLGFKKPLPLKKLQQIKQTLKEIEKQIKEIDQELLPLVLEIPNLPLESEPNDKIIKTWGRPLKIKNPKDYLEIAQKFDLIDVKRASKTSGTRFGFLKKEAALLEFALISFTYETLLKEGFEPVIPPVMIKPEMAKATGYPEQFEGEEAYFLEKDKLFLVGTAEQIIAPMHSNEVFDQKDLPKRYLAFSSCFRREAGSWGKETWGIFRVHQFDKIEMFSFCHPDKSKKEHQFFLNLEEKLMQALKIPYRVVKIGASNLSFPSAATYDIEAFFPSRKEYLETHSTSNCTDFQARRLNIKFKDKNGKLNFVHTVNGTAFAMGRIIIAIIENYQTKDQKIKIPQVLRKFLKKSIIG